MLANLTVVIIIMLLFQINMLSSLNSYNVICQLYLIKAGEGKVHMGIEKVVLEK